MSVQLKFSFVISQLKHMLFILKRNVLRTQNICLKEMTTYKLNAYRQILEILYVCIYHDVEKLLWKKILF